MEAPIEREIYGDQGRRRPIRFVPASPIVDAKEASRKTKSLGERYLDIVLHNPTKQAEAKSSICPTCHFPLASPEARDHDLCLVHQSSTVHSYPPSHLDRQRQGMKYLTDCGWDPDSRRGLGLNESGRRAPIRAVPKHDTLGIGVKVPAHQFKIKPKRNLDAGQVRKLVTEDKRRAEKLHALFYQNDDVQRYLGED